MMDYEKVKERIMPILINAKNNEEYLAEVPHIPFLDMEIVFYFCFNVNERLDDATTIRIKNSHMQQWGINTDELYRTAMANAQDAQPARLYSMDGAIDAVFARMASTADFEPEDEVRDDDGQLFSEYVLSNQHLIYGAVCLAYDELLKKYAEEIGSFYILPSSIHEVILIPSSDNNRMEEYTAAVCERNKAYVPLPEEVLSEHAYYYDAGKCTVVY